jgi:hypothetical protein
MARFFKDLPHSAQEAYPAIAGGVRRGLSIAAIGDLARSKGFAISSDALRQAVALERAIFSYGDRLRFLAKGARPTDAKIPEALGQLRRAYSFQVTVKGRPTAGGQPFETFVTVTSDSILTRGEIEDAAVESVEGSAGRYGMTVDSAVLSGALKAGTSGVF